MCTRVQKPKGVGVPQLPLSIFLYHSYPQLNICGIGEAKLLSSMLLRKNKDLQKKLIGRRFMRKCSHPTVRPALPRDFVHSQ